MIIVDVPDNPNCSTVEMRVFHDVEPPRSIEQIRWERQPGHPAWFDVTGWTASSTTCPVLLQKVDDSGEGVAFLVYGGDAGIRLRPSGRNAPWRLEDAQQWGEPFLILTDLDDVRCGELHAPCAHDPSTRPATSLEETKDGGHPGCAGLAQDGAPLAERNDAPKLPGELHGRTHG